MISKKFRSVNEYFDSVNADSLERLSKIRKAIIQTAPGATEKISYNMPAFELHGNLCYYCAFTNHTSLFPHPSAIEKFKSDLKDFVTSKGTIQFPNSEKIPISLIKKIIKFRVKENLEKYFEKESKNSKKKSAVRKKKARVKS